MTPYEIIVACVAVTNLVFTLAVFQANRGKAAAARLAELEGRVNDGLQVQALQIAALRGGAEKAPSHTDLSKIYDQLNDTRSQIDTLAGSVEQMNANLRLVLAKYVNEGPHHGHRR